MIDLLPLLGVYLIDILFISALTRLGWKAVGFGILANFLMVTVIARKEIEVFRYITNAGNIPYAAVIYGMTLLACRYDFKGVMKMVTAAALSLTVFLIMGKALSELPVIVGNEGASSSLRFIFDVSGQIAVASFIAFYCAVSVNTVLMHLKIKKAAIRKILANIAAQLVDSALFFPIAFLGILEPSVIITAALIGFLFKISLNIIDTPIFYILVKLGIIARIPEISYTRNE